MRVYTAPHVQSALSFQNFLVSTCNIKSLKFGKVSFYSLLILLALPFEMLALLFNFGGVMNFEAKKPVKVKKIGQT